MEGVSFLSGTCYQYFLSVHNGILSVNYVDYSDRLIPWSGTHFFVTDRSFFVKLEGLLPCYKGLSMNPVLRRLNPVHTSIAYTSLNIDLSWLPVFNTTVSTFRDWIRRIGMRRRGKKASFIHSCRSVSVCQSSSATNCSFS